MGETFRLRTSGTKPAPRHGNTPRVALTRAGTVAALDVGSSKIACVIARTEGGEIRVLGSALHEAQGLRSGAVVSLDLAEQAIRETVDAAEQLAGTRIQEVIISAQCGQPKSIMARAEHSVDGQLVGDSMIRDILSDARRLCHEEGYETIQAAPTSYVVDQLRGVRDPRGMFCERLGVSMHAVAMRPGPLHNLRLAVERCHLNVSRQLFSPYASALSTMTPDEMQLGATLIDMGAGCTSVAVFMEDSLVYVDTVPIGGQHVTSDVARVLSAPLNAAERIKTLYGSALSEIEAGTDTIEVPQMGEESEAMGTRVRRSLLTKIIQSRMEEIFNEVQGRLQKGGYDVAAGRRLILTGGACQLAGARELAGRILNKQVRLGRPQTFPGLAAATAGPAYASVLGLLMAGASHAPEALEPAQVVEENSERRGLSRWLGTRLFG